MSQLCSIKAVRIYSRAGFTYISLIILLAIIALVSAATLRMGVMVQRSIAEQELLNIGAEFSDALQSYADATPAGQPTQPPGFKELLKDPRFPGTRRHLRKVFVDPVSGKAEWGVLYLGDKVGIIGIYSLSDARPVKIGNFPVRFQGFEGKNHLSDWKFTATGKGSIVRPVVSAQQPIVLPAQNVLPASEIPNNAPQTPATPSEEPIPAPPVEPEVPVEPAETMPEMQQK
ncbi:type II secretion system protein [Oxalobacteraceae bacterium]|nr:type II secretion system protein [Oxalobacteraceae bacterium]